MWTDAIRRLLPLMIAAVLSVPATGSAAAGTIALAVALAPAGNAGATASPYVIAISRVNRGRKAVDLPVQNGAAGELEFAIKVFDAAGRPLAPTEFKRKLGTGELQLRRSARFVHLAPGEAVTTTADLSRLFVFPGPGRYRIVLDPTDPVTGAAADGVEGTAVTLTLR